MNALHFHFTASALAVALAVAAPGAGAATNLITNYDFHNVDPNSELTGWTRNLYNGAKTHFTYVASYQNEINKYGIVYYGQFQCEGYCPAGQTQSVSQQVSNLIHNENYQLTFYASGYSYATDKNNVLTNYDPAPIDVNFGGTSLGSFPAKWYDWKNSSDIPWVKEVVNFTWGGGSSGVLSFVQHLTGVDPGCFPCADFYNLSNVTLTDVGANGGGGVSEPSSLAALGLGLGALGLVYLRLRGSPWLPRLAQRSGAIGLRYRMAV